MAIFYVQKISTTNKTQVTYSYNNYSSMTFVNTHATAAITIDLYVTAQIYSSSTDITSTTVLAAETAVASANSVTLNVDTIAPTDDVFKDERVYKSDGTFFGIATATDTTPNPDTITFATGLKTAITNNDILFTGTRYHVLNNVKIPNGTSLKLSSDEFNFDNNNYNLYINSDSATGDIDILIRS